MENVIVVKEVPGILDVGDILTLEGDDFLVYSTIEEDNDGHIELSRYINIDKTTVYNNIPEYFSFLVDDSEIEVTDVTTTKKIVRTPAEIAERVEFFERQLKFNFNTESKVVYQNILWFIEWLNGERDLLK